MPPIERKLRQRRNVTWGIDFASDLEATHQTLRSAGIEDVDDDEPRRASPDRAVRAQKCEERRPGARGERQGVAQTVDKTFPFDAVEIHLPLHQ
ncbi:MAG: hypothetical protein HZC06_14535 [Methylocystis sp.]|nr:hypothetical protein [Methylocystis sp.]